MAAVEKEEAIIKAEQEKAAAAKEAEMAEELEREAEQVIMSRHLIKIVLTNST